MEDSQKKLEKQLTQLEMGSQPLILASRSPRRAELLRKAGYSFIVDPADDSVETGCCTDRTPVRLVAELSRAKAVDVALRTANPKAVILGADTIAECDGQILGKPCDESHARQILKILSGKKHSVLTGVSLCRGGTQFCVTHVEQTLLEMQPLSDQQIEDYLSTDLWIGKAGAFGYQDGPPWLTVTKGLESNVVGLPVERLPEMLKQLESAIQ